MTGRRSRYLIGALCIAISAIMFAPLAMSVLASVKPTAEAAASPPTYVPHALSLDSYRRLWTYQEGLPTYLANSLGTAVLAIALTLALTVPAGYALARFPIPGKEAIFVVLLLALIVPYQALLTPIFLMFAKIGLTNTLLGLAIVHTAIQLPFSLYILRNSFSAVPPELEEAAMIDGATRFGAFWRVVLPLSAPGVLAAALYAFTQAWNEFLYALVFITNVKLRTLPVGLSSFITGDVYGWGYLMAGAVLTTLPVIAAYIYLQKYMVEGLTAGSVKG